MPSATLTAIALGLFTSLAWAGANVFVQRAGRSLGALRAMFWSQFLGALILVPAAMAFEPWPANISWVALGFSCLGSAVGYFAMLRAFELGPIGAITPVIASWAVPATLIAMMLGERPTWPVLAGAFLVILGAAVNGALARGGEWRAPLPVAYSWALAGSVGFGVMVAGMGQLGGQIGPVGVVPLVWAGQWVLLAPFILYAPTTLRPPADWSNVLGMAVLEASGFVAYAWALRVGSVAVVSPPASLSSIMTVLFSAIWLGEKLGWARWLSVVGATAGLVLMGA